MNKLEKMNMTSVKKQKDFKKEPFFNCIFKKERKNKVRILKIVR